MTQGKQNEGQTKGGQTKGGQTKGGQTKGSPSPTKQKKQPETKENDNKHKQDESKHKDSKGQQKSGKDSSKSGNESKNSGNDTARSGKSGSQTARSDKSDSSSTTPRTKKQNYFQEELKRLKSSLDQEKSKIEEPEEQEHIPVVFNTLEPYYNVYTTQYLMEYPEELRHEFVTRQTATGLCDPWVDHEMDVTPGPRPELPRKPEEEEDEEQQEEEEEKKEKKKKEQFEGSTRLPKYPVVVMQTSDLNDKPLYYSDVPTLRDELEKKYSSGAETKINQDYKRTKDDFYRMELHKMEDYHPVSRPSMRAAYFAYLQNNPGSKKAVKECVKEVEQKEKEEKDKKQKDKRQESAASSRAVSARSGKTEDDARSMRSQKSTARK